MAVGRLERDQDPLRRRSPRHHHMGGLGNRGHIAFEVHDNDATFGEARWGTGAQCRWRNIRIKDLGETEIPA
jgi:hypothetical protein